ncbi:MAG: hypothetical protein H8E60_05775 [Candidatus Marinimicrobia bacterium]|nr:hypothetical protein [Candidatus Neomarinimicrobiota bacterium]
MLQSILTPLSIVIIIAFYVLLRNHPKHKYILPTILSSLGILGTFTGIAIGLYAFDVNNIDTSVPKLLEGLKLAFVSSITGIILTILKKFELSREDEEDEIPDTQESIESNSENVVPILKELLNRNDYNEKLDELNLKLSGDNNKSLAHLMSEMLKGINQLNLKADSQSNETPQNLESQIKKLLDSNKSNNDELLSFIKKLSSSIGIETNTDESQKQMVSLLQELLVKDDYSAKLDELTSKLSGLSQYSVILGDISDGIKKLRFQTEQSQEDQQKDLKKQFKELVSSITQTNENLKHSINKFTLTVGESTKEVVPSIEQNMSQFSENLGKTMLEATEKMSQSFEKKSTEADEAGKWQVRSVIELQELNTNIKKLLKESDNQTQQITDNNKRLIYTLKHLLEDKAKINV